MPSMPNEIKIKKKMHKSFQHVVIFNKNTLVILMYSPFQLSSPETVTVIFLFPFKYEVM